METIKPKTNVPIVGQLKKAFYQHNERAKEEGWPPQVKLQGVWEGEGQGNVYGPLILTDMLEKEGVLHKPVDEDGNRLTDRYGNHKYVIVGEPTVCLVKKEVDSDDGSRIMWEVTVGDAVKPPDEAEYAVPHTDDEIPHPADDYTDRKPDESKVTFDRKEWARLQSRWLKAAALAVKVHTEADIEVDNDRLSQTATAFFIEANRRNLD